MIDHQLVWVDLEMTGLDPMHDTILEIAIIITDADLNIIVQGPHFIIHHDESIVPRMNTIVRTMHEESGLLSEVFNSPITLTVAYQKTLDFIRAQCTYQKAFLSGNSIWQDRLFLQKYMPAVIARLHYRLIDISSIKELVRLWHPNHAYIKKEKKHRALDDIRASIDELSYYRTHFFNHDIAINR